MQSTIFFKTLLLLGTTALVAQAAVVRLRASAARSEEPQVIRVVSSPNSDFEFVQPSQLLPTHTFRQQQQQQQPQQQARPRSQPLPPQAQPQGRLIRVVPNNNQRFQTEAAPTRQQLQPALVSVDRGSIPQANLRQASANVASARVRAPAASANEEPEKPVEEGEEVVVDQTPRPYKIEYDSVDNNGTTMRREENRDEKGVIRGSYSYTDPFGIYRVVEYIADENGFRASIRTNEPGVAKTENGDPAGVLYEIDPPPRNGDNNLRALPNKA